MDIPVLVLSHASNHPLNAARVVSMQLTTYYRCGPFGGRCAIVSDCALSAGCSKDPPPSPVKVSVHGTSSDDDASNNNIIEAVRQSVSAKHFTESVWQTQRQPHTCTQLDVERDPRARDNPELARCPRVGATYYTDQQTQSSTSVQCPSLPGPQMGRTVSAKGPDSWWVSQAGNSWAVRRAGKGAFSVVAHQRC
jgi:hypothetical protein